MIARLPSHLATFGQRCTSYTPHASGITLHFKPSSSAPTASPTSYEADVLICTDGIRSRLREHLYTRKGLEVQSQVAQYAEWVAWRGLIPVEKYEEVMGKGAKKKVMLCGPQKHILTFPVRRGELVNIVSSELERSVRGG